MRSLNILSFRATRLSAYLFGLLVFGVGLVLDGVLMNLGASGKLMMVVADLFTGVAAGFALWLALRHELRHRIEQEHRLDVLDEMNHHVRNALQIMTLHSYSIGGEQGEELARAVRRIQWSLTEVLPKVNFETPVMPNVSEDFSYHPVKKSPSSEPGRLKKTGTESSTPR